MTDRETTILLTKLGFLYLKKMGCYNISTEIPILIRDHYQHENDRHYHIDVLGISKKYIPYKEQKDENVKWFNVLRGIEIKVSKSDFKNGFIHGGCHYNYLMILKGLIEPSQVHTDVGIIEVDLETVAVKKPKFTTMQNQGFYLSGIQITRKPKPKKAEDWLVERILNSISDTLTNQAKRWLVDELTKGKVG